MKKSILLACEKLKCTTVQLKYLFKYIELFTYIPLKIKVLDIYFIHNNIMNVPSRCTLGRVVNPVLFFFVMKMRLRLRDAVYDYHMYPSGLFSF